MIVTDNTLILISILACALIAALSIMRASAKTPPSTDAIEPIELHNRDEILAMIDHELTIKLAAMTEEQLLAYSADLFALRDAGRTPDG